MFLHATKQAHEFSDILHKLHEESYHRFQDLRREENEIDLLTSPFSFDVKEVSYNLQTSRAN
jgi:hypothetical protein